MIFSLFSLTKTSALQIYNLLYLIISLINYNYIFFPIFILSVHWLGVRFYSEFCSPPDFYGYITSYFTVASPTCIYVLQMIEKTSNIYNVIWATFSMWTCTIFINSYKRLVNK